jgi:hypothetical protein
LNNPLKPPGFDLGQPNPGQYGPPAPGSTNNPQQADLWSRLMGAVGNPGAGGLRMPGTTVGAPAGQTPPSLPSPFPFPQTQAPRPPGIPYFNQGGLQNPAGNAGLMGQYLALQQLMRGS